MARKFDNGASFGTVREILNQNADEINANKTAAMTLANSSTGNGGRVQGNGNAILNRGANPATITSDAGGGIYWNNGVGLPTIRVLELGLSLKQLANNMANAVGSGIIYMLAGRYLSGWKGDASLIYLGYAIFNKGCIVAVDLETSKLWVCRQDNNYQWVTASVDTSGIEAEIAAVKSTADAAKAGLTGPAGGALTGNYPNPTINQTKPFPPLVKKLDAFGWPQREGANIIVGNPVATFASCVKIQQRSGGGSACGVYYELPTEYDSADNKQPVFDLALLLSGDNGGCSNAYKLILGDEQANPDGVMRIILPPSSSFIPIVAKGKSFKAGSIAIDIEAAVGTNPGFKRICLFEAKGETETVRLVASDLELFTARVDWDKSRTWVEHEHALSPTGSSLSPELMRIRLILSVVYNETRPDYGLIYTCEAHAYPYREDLINAMPLFEYSQEEIGTDGVASASVLSARSGGRRPSLSETMRAFAFVPEPEEVPAPDVAEDSEERGGGD